MVVAAAVASGGAFGWSPQRPGRRRRPAAFRAKSSPQSRGEERTVVASTLRREPTPWVRGPLPSLSERETAWTASSAAIADAVSGRRTLYAQHC
ncbi:hypothetical protein MTO96_010887 [Rhipicephalus appendiculatus]